jgi:hypothetical protein
MSGNRGRLAGASAFLEQVPVAGQVPIARERALRYAQLNRIRVDSLDALNVTVQPVRGPTAPRSEPIAARQSNCSASAVSENGGALCGA